MKSGTQIHVKEPTGLRQLIHQLIKYWHRKFGLSSQSIEMSEVHVEPIGIIFLLHQQYKRREAAGTWLDEALLQHVRHLSLYLILQTQGIWIRPNENRPGSRDQRNSMVACLGRRQ